MRLAVTGAGGFLGWHLRCALHAEGIDTLSLGRAELGEPSHALAARLSDVQVVVHAAGVNRGADADVESGNLAAATALGEALRLMAGEGEPPLPHVVYLNSTHHDRPTAYGRSKAAAAGVLAAQVPADGFLDMVLPGVFGEGGRPHYNSVVATFCHQLAGEMPVTVTDDAEIELVHAQDVADAVIAAARLRTCGQQRVVGRHVSVGALAEQLQAMHLSYAAGVVPALADEFQRALFNTMRSYRFPRHYPHELLPRTDPRGRLVELVKADTGGQMFFSSTVPGITRGDHYHRRKVERFVVVEGEAVIRIRRLFTDEVVSFDVSGAQPVAIDMPTMHTHHITNTGSSTLLTLFWADELFDPLHPDTYGSLVLGPSEGVAS